VFRVPDRAMARYLLQQMEELHPIYLYGATGIPVQLLIFYVPEHIQLLLKMSMVVQ
jgi:hypothetical protein